MQCTVSSQKKYGYLEEFIRIDRIGNDKVSPLGGQRVSYRILKAFCVVLTVRTVISDDQGGRKLWSLKALRNRQVNTFLA